jgi:3-phenylpropionate/trans-cinnamate dioxygenase ferredoxin component
MSDDAVIWREAASESEFESKDRKLLDFGGEKQIGLFKLEDGYYAISAWCSHQKTSMMQGDVEDGKLMCPLHGAWFDIRDGKNLSLPAVKPVPSYPVKVEDGTIWIEA